jgi:hypothetical protein
LALAGCDGPSASQQRVPRPAVSRFNGTLERGFKDPQARQLAIAAERNDAAEVRRLMKEEHINPDVFFSDKDDGFPLLAWPILTKSLEGLRAMLENGANPNVYQPTSVRLKLKQNQLVVIILRFCLGAIWLQGA